MTYQQLVKEAPCVIRPSHLPCHTSGNAPERRTLQNSILLGFMAQPEPPHVGGRAYSHAGPLFVQVGPLCMCDVAAHVN